jgi:branched-chain amino acid transport system ATP-binding protein
MAAGTGKICLELRKVGIEFRQHRVLKDITLTLEEQEIVSVIGPNGAGKTTLFNIICGRIHPARGTVLFRGRDITRWPPHRICHAGIARTFQIARPFPDMTALENILIGLWFGKKSTSALSAGRDEALELLDLVGLGHKRDLAAKELTLSELRRLEVARALGTKPQLLLLDEIAAGLSPQAIKRSVELVKALRDRGLTLLIIDHFLNLTAIVSDRLIALDQGEKIMEGKPSEVLECPEVISSYLGERQQSGREENIYEA